METVTGESMPQLYRRHLLGPLGLDDTNVSGTSGDAESTALDLAKVAQMLVNGGAYGDKRFFRPEVLEAAKPQPLSELVGPECDVTWGVGMFYFKDDPMAVSPGLSGKDFGHHGGSRSTCRIDPENDLVFTMTRNNAGDSFLEHCTKLMEAIDESIVR